MGSLTKAQLNKLFTRIDKRLTKNLNVHIIGGGAAILGYDVTKETNDIDTDGAIDTEFQNLFDEEVTLLNLNLYLSEVGVFTPPDGYRERMKFEDFPKKRLRIWYLDQYDLAISKIDRGSEKDYADIHCVHKKSPYDRNQLINLFKTEYINVVAIGNKRVKMMNLIDLVTLLFGNDFVADTKVKIGFK